MSAAKPNDLETLLNIQRALIRTMKTMVQTQQTHTRLLEEILDRLPDKETTGE